MTLRRFFAAILPSPSVPRRFPRALVSSRMEFWQEAKRALYRERSETLNHLQSIAANFPGDENEERAGRAALQFSVPLTHAEIVGWIHGEALREAMEERSGR